MSLIISKLFILPILTSSLKLTSCVSLYRELYRFVLLFRNGVDTDNMDESHLEEEVVEFLVKEEETVVQDWTSRPPEKEVVVQD